MVCDSTRIPDRATDRPQTLDLFLTNKPDQYGVTVSAPLGSSDHCLVTLEHDILVTRNSISNTRLLWKYEGTDWDTLRTFYGTFPWKDVCFSDCPSDSADSVTEIILIGMETHIPHFTKHIKLKDPKWFGGETRISVADKNKAFKIWKRNPTPENRSEYVRLRNACKSTVSKAKDSFISKIAEKLSESPSYDRRFWSLAHSISRNFGDSLLPPLKLSNGEICSTPLEKADAFAEVFASSSQINVPNSAPSPVSQTDPMGELKITTRQVRQVLLKLDTNKSVGPDGIPAIVLKKCAPELAPVLQKLFSLSLATGIFPSVWKLAHIVPTHKRGARTSVNNYRPISITSIISKVFEVLVNAHILNHIESRNLLSDHQYGFRKARSTGDLLAYVTHVWAQALEAFGESRVITLDISKAFDRVWHAKLISKLPSFGFRGELMSWVSSFLTQRMLAVRVDGVTSDCRTVNAGVPQGCVLSPTLFLIFINDLLSSLSSRVHSYADDATIHCSSFFRNQAESRTNISQSRQDISERLSEDIDRVLQWGSNNLVDFNSSKTQHLAISTKKSQVFPSVTMGCDTLEDSSSVSILGLRITSHLAWNEHINSITKRAFQKLGLS